MAIDMWLLLLLLLLLLLPLLLLLLLLLLLVVMVMVVLLAKLRSLYCTWRWVVNILWMLHDVRRMTVCHWRYLGWWRR